MRFILSVVLCASLLATIGCGGSGKIPIKDATPEQIQQQKDAESQVKTEESQMRKKPKEMTQQQSVDEQERARRR